MALKSPSEGKHARPRFAPGNAGSVVSLRFSVPSLCSTLRVEAVIQSKQGTCGREETSAESFTDQPQPRFTKEGNFCRVTLIVCSGSENAPCNSYQVRKK